MCGITGWFSSSPLTPDAHQAIAAMTHAIRHRGPDGTGHILRRHAALGHARLAIIDVGGGAQPMSTPDNNVSISFNGEIFNYRELRQGLEQSGVQFRTQSDTEVLLQVYRRYGWQGFSQLRGMYALAIWDESNQTGLLARDPQGIKPLFFARHQDRLVFASEAKAIQAIPDLCTELDPAALHLVMNFRYLPGRRSLFRGIEQLPPGVALVWSRSGDWREHTVAPLTFPPEDPLAALRGSVRAHLTADVEVGSYLSGGIDSATITALANEESGAPLRTFTLDVGDNPEESRHAARSAELLGNPNIQSAFSDDVSDSLPRLVWHLEVPKVNAMQVHQLAIVARRHVKVVLSGLGGDELFLGYNAHRILHQAEWASHLLPGPIHRVIGSAGLSLIRHGSNIPWTETERAFVMLRELGRWQAVYGVLRNVWDSPRLRRLVYGPRMLDANLPNAFTELEKLWPAQDDPVMACAQFEWQQKMVNDLLWQEDRVSMAEGLEVRVPFVDIPLRQSIAHLARHELMPRGRPKGYMRHMVQGLLPAEVLRRPKSGFQVDSPNFFHRYLRRWEDPYLGSKHVRQIGLFNPEFVQAVRGYPVRQRTRWHYFMLYLILGTHLWVELFEKRTWPTPQ